MADVAGELIPDPESGDLVHAYRTVTVAVPRRGGKSVLVLARLVATVSAADRMFAWYAAQNGKAGAERFRNDWVPLVRHAPFIGDRFQPRLTNGTEALADRDHGSIARIFAPIPTALHGDAADLVVFDESWSHSRERGQDLEVAAYPLMATRPGAQLWAVSAAGDVDSEWWTDQITNGRAAVEADRGTGHCHLEWTAEGIDPDRWGEEDVWLDVHPGIRTKDNPSGQVSLQFLRDEYERDPDQFARSYLNVTDRTGTTSAPIDLATWEGLATEAPERGAVAFGVDVAPDHAATAIVAAHVRPGHVTVEVVDYRPGYEWAAGRVVELCDSWDVVAVGLDGSAQSPASVLLRPLVRRLGDHLVRDLSLEDCTSASASIVSRSRSGTIRNVPHPALDGAVRGGRRRNIGDGSWLWDRRSADVDVCPLVAATYATHVHPDVDQWGDPGIH